VPWENLRGELEDEFADLAHDDRAVVSALAFLSVRKPKSDYFPKGRRKGKDPEKRAAWLASEAGKQCRHNYNTSDLGREARRRYAYTEKGAASEAASRAKYRGSPKDRAARTEQMRRYRARKKAIPCN
jgi:hypothetical protein